MSNPDLLILVVGVFVTFMAVWGTVAYGVLVVQRKELAQSGLDAYSASAVEVDPPPDPAAP